MVFFYSNFLNNFKNCSHSFIVLQIINLFVMKHIFFIIVVYSLLLSNNSFSQEKTVDNVYNFKIIKELEYTSVKDQYRTGTCWSFATVSFFESELIRLGHGSYDISEMFFVNHAYKEKADRYVRFHGASNFGPGGQAHDVINIMRKYGIATQQEYPGLLKDESKHDHGELDAVLEGFLKSVVNNKGGKISKVWPEAFKSIIDSYIGVAPNKKDISNSKEDKSDFSTTLGLDPDDYIELTSYSHHPLYEAIVLEIPDNWSTSLYYNLPIDELLEVIHYSLQNGYSVCWDGDVSDKGFSHANGLAIIPELQPISTEGTEMSKWEKMTEKERNELVYNFKELRKEKFITQEMRQDAFNNYQSTDDHLMHMVGIVQDQTGKNYFRVKNSWSDKSNSFGGLLNMSEAYVRLNTIAIMVHRDAIPKSILKKLGL